MHALYDWLFSASRDQKRALLAAALGWMLDSMDVMLYAFVLGPVQREMHLTSAEAGAMMSATLIAAAIGGIGFGVLADRIGRTRALMGSMLLYSVATALCGFSHSAMELAAYRVLLGLGMGGEWASGAALVAETWPTEHRGKALAVVQSFWAVGYALGAAIVAVVLPHFGWRAVFFVGIAPALLTLWIQRKVHEPEAFQKQRVARPPVRELFRGRLGRGMLVCASMNAAALFAWWGLFTWLPRFLSLPVAQGGRGLSILQTSGWTIVMQIGTFLGYLTFGYLADRFSRKYSYIAYLLIAAVLVPVFTWVRNPQALLFIGPLVGFFGTGYFSGFSVITSELFPTPLRATAMGFVYNIGRVVSAAAPWLIGGLSQHAGLGAALGLTSVAFVLAACVATALPATPLHEMQGVPHA